MEFVPCVVKLWEGLENSKIEMHFLKACNCFNPNGRTERKGKTKVKEVAGLVRDVPPMHYIFKIESFSSLKTILLKTDTDKYESSDFEAGGYKWRLVLYPNGNTKEGVNNFISLYLAISDSNELPIGWEVNVIFKFLVFDQIRDKYLTLEDGVVRRYRASKTEWGFPKLLLESTLNDPSNGYLINDCCVFGAEVFVIKSEGKGESFSLIREPENATFTWELDKFSGLKEEFYLSEGFTVGGCQWKLALYPNGASSENGQSLSLFLCLHDHLVLRPGCKLYVGFTLSMMDKVLGPHYMRRCDTWFCKSNSDRGFIRFISLSYLNGEGSTFIINDTIIVEAKIRLMSIVNYFA